uniref:NADH-ubiquinone oxidoreductase chain 6 n=1 Tax=Coscinodiscus granii TaxID=265552 RepID=A0A8A6W2E8_9STRA|nr:NADH dehydrogenase subunit 6 [Coscinodiscus granii]QTK21677.1 NADH dehydrogenase subunit 6 [Coscinodiscus granii]
MIDNLIIFLFCLIIINSSIIIFSTNSVHSVLFLILNFIISSFIVLLFEREFLALSFLIIYVGAISILFLFVIMMLDTKAINYNKDIIKYFPIGFLICAVLILEISYVFLNNFTFNNYNNLFFYNEYINWYTKLDSISDIVVIGNIMYTHFVIQFLIAGLILLLAVISVIVLMTDNLQEKPKKQLLFKQISRNFKNI